MKTNYSKSIGRTLLLVEAQLFIFMAFQTGASGYLFALAILQTILHSIVFSKRGLIFTRKFPVVLFVLLALILTSNYLGQGKVTFIVYVVPLIFYCLFWIENQAMQITFVVVILLLSSVSQYIAVHQLEMVLMFLVGSISLSILFMTALRNLSATQAQLRKQNKAMIEAELNMKALLANTDWHIWSVDAKYQFITGNESFKRWMKKKQILVSSGTDLVHSLPDRKEKEHWKTLYDRAFKGEHFFLEQVEFEFGSSITMEYNFSPMKMPSGEIFGVSVMAKDISRKKEYIRQRQENEALLNGVLDNMPIGFSLFDQHGTLTIMNSALLKMLEIPRADKRLLGSFNVLSDPLFVSSGLDEAFARVYTKGCSLFYEYEMDFGRKENKWKTTRKKIFMEVNLFPLFDENKKVKAVVALTNAIDKRKETERQMLEQNKRLEEYSFTLSHIIRRPVANLISLTSLLKLEDGQDEDGMKLIDYVHESAEQLDAIIRELNRNISIKTEQ